MLFPYILNITSSFIVSVLLSVVFVVCVIMPALFFLIVKNLKKCVGYLEKCDFCINTHTHTHTILTLLYYKNKVNTHTLCVVFFRAVAAKGLPSFAATAFCLSPTVNHLNIFCYAERK